ncbi:MAG: methyltransferase domain-containing protein [Bacteroidetes bacterium]|nr:MAG: methyltransferase domain-containing protein [Bacteroidota bacterium]
MGLFFIHIYRFFHQHRWIFWLFLILTSVFIILTASRIHLEEDISSVTSKKDMLHRDEYVIRNFTFAEKLVIHLRQVHDTETPNPDKLIAVACALSDSLEARLDSTYIQSIFLKLDEAQLPRALELIDNHLPLFLEEADYTDLDSLRTCKKLETIVRNNYRILVSPASMVMKRRLIQDPLGISTGILKKLSKLQADDRYTLRNGYIFSQDGRHLLFFITPANPPSETGKNGFLIRTLDRLIDQLAPAPDPPEPEDLSPIEIDYFGSVAVAVGNANQLKTDILLSLSLALIAIFLLIGWYFRNPAIPLIGFIPAFFGGGLALGSLYLIKGSVSAIALGIGSVILGLIIDYALYMINHFRKKQNVEEVIRDMAQTIFVCCLTSVGAFLCLVFLNSAVLHDLGWFAAISVAGAALFALIILPQFLGPWLLPQGHRGEQSNREERSNLIDRIASVSFGRKTWLILGLAVAGIVSLFFLKRVAFETDLNSLSYMPDKLKRAEQALDQISSASFKKVYLVSTGETLDQALQLNERAIRKLEVLRDQGLIHGWSGISTFLLSDSIQEVRLRQWNSYWTDSRKDQILRDIRKAGQQAGFTREAFTGLEEMFSRSYSSLSNEEKTQLKETLFNEWVQETPELTMVTAVTTITEPMKPSVYEAFRGDPGMVLFDRQNLTSRFVENVRVDFDRLVLLSMIFVSGLLLLSFGRIELGFTTALPMFFAWLLTLGFMGLFGIKFNIFNIIISSFVFGLGVDYSILMMRGLLNEYRTGTSDLKTYRVSIFLSSATTIFGVAALFVARHPALHSIALISIVGVVAVVLVSYAYQEMLASWFLFKPKRKRQFPVTLFIAYFSVIVAWIPISSIALILVVYGVVISPLLPLSRKRKQEIFHRLFSRMSQIYIAMNFPRYHRVENPQVETFEKPAIIISNHQSLIETPALLRLSPNILILTTEWVYRHWIFGPVAKLAGFPPMAEGIDASLDSIKQRMDEGYSILIFPEGTRSKDGRIQRFHRGAFYIAEKLHVDILPILIFGSGNFLPKGNFWGRPSRLFMKILPRIKPDDQEFGATYSERTRLVRRLYSQLYHDFRLLHGTPAYFHLPVRLNYVFKGPVLEWYVRIKMGLERNFQLYHDLLPKRGTILDLGCGYGYISYMLMLTSSDRTVTGVDFDEGKIITARNGYLKNSRIDFVHADVADYPLVPHDGILLGDVLHYLSPEKQTMLLDNCMNNLRPGGVLLIREGIRELEERHKKTRLSEFFSTRVVNFNQTQDATKQLWFISADEIRKEAEANGLSFEVVDQGKRSSNVFIAIIKKQ